MKSQYVLIAKYNGLPKTLIIAHSVEAIANLIKLIELLEICWQKLDFNVLTEIRVARKFTHILTYLNIKNPAQQ